jgi:ATP-dependent DNA helicase RecQ
VKAVVATSALGMGYDKPDLGFVVHFQAPSSAIAYYQQVGRAGRGVAEAHAVLLRGAEDRAIQDFFIESAFPPERVVDAVLEALDAADRPVSLPALQAEVNLGRGRLEGLLKVLDVEGRGTARGVGLAAHGAAVGLRRRALRCGDRAAAAEQAAMAPTAADGRCSVPPSRARRPDARVRALLGVRRPALRRRARPASREAQRLLRSRPSCSRQEQTPKTATAGKRHQPRAAAREGRALSRAATAGGPLVRRGPPRRRFDDELSPRAPRSCAAGARALPRGSRRAVRRSASSSRPRRRLADALELRYVDALERTGRRARPQREMANSRMQVANVAASSRSPARPRREPGLLIDDVRASGWTLATVGAQLRQRGAGPLHPLVLALAGA